VTDDLGNPAKQADAGELTLGSEFYDVSGNRGAGDRTDDRHFRAPIVSVKDGTTIITEHNPTCCWYYFRGIWYWICY
jgi:hypothetical protein